MSMTFDFAKLAAANELLWKWGERFGIHNGKFLNFVYKLKQNQNDLIKELKNAKWKQEFKKDCKVMFYAAEIENDLFKQYRPVVGSVVNRFKLKSGQAIENAYDIGVSSLRGAIWRYRFTHVKFLSYAMTGVMMAVKGYVVHRHYMKDRRAKHVQIFCNSDTDIMFTDNLLFADKREKDPAETITDIPEIDENNIAQFAKLTSDENMLLKLHIQRQNYPQSFMAYYLKRHKKKISRRSVNDMLQRTRRKIFINVKQIKGVEFMRQFREPSKIG